MEIFEGLQGSFLILIKIGIIAFLVIYNVFSVIVVKQVRIMTEALEVGFEAPVRLLAYAHLTFSLGILILAFLIL